MIISRECIERIQLPLPTVGTSFTSTPQTKQYTIKGKGYNVKYEQQLFLIPFDSYLIIESCLSHHSSRIAHNDLVIFQEAYQRQKRVQCSIYQNLPFLKASTYLQYSNGLEVSEFRTRIFFFKFDQYLAFLMPCLES